MFLILALSDTVLHVLHDQVRGAEIDEATDCILCREQASQKFDKLLLTSIRVDQVLILLYDCETLLELGVAVLLAHVRTEFIKIAAGDVDHLFLTEV